MADQVSKASQVLLGLMADQVLLGLMAGQVFKEQMATMELMAFGDLMALLVSKAHVVGEEFRAAQESVCVTHALNDMAALWLNIGGMTGSGWLFVMIRCGRFGVY